MEIHLLQLYHTMNELFKIDLIVWKYSSCQYITVPPFRFKIDLIVWKWPISESVFRFNKLFKIDLIVWKYELIEMIEEGKFSLK